MRSLSNRHTQLILHSRFDTGKVKVIQMRRRTLTLQIGASNSQNEVWQSAVALYSSVSCSVHEPVCPQMYSLKCSYYFRMLVRCNCRAWAGQKFGYKTPYLDEGGMLRFLWYNTITKTVMIFCTYLLYFSKNSNGSKVNLFFFLQYPRIPGPWWRASRSHRSSTKNRSSAFARCYSAFN